MKKNLSNANAHSGTLQLKQLPFEIVIVQNESQNICI